jgi:hypothetical protein
MNISRLSCKTQSLNDTLTAGPIETVHAYNQHLSLYKIISTFHGNSRLRVIIPLNNNLDKYVYQMYNNLFQ